MQNCTDKCRINSPHWMKQALSHAVNLREVELKIASFDDHDNLHFLTEFPFSLEGLKTLSKVTVQLPEKLWEMPSDLGFPQYDRIVGGMMNHLGQRLGVRGQKIHRFSQNPSDDPSRIYITDNTAKWTWEAYPGRLMDWSQGLGRIWKPPQPRLPASNPTTGRDLESEQIRVLEKTWLLRFWNR